MKKLLIFLAVLLCVGLASAAQDLPPDVQTLMIFLDEYSEGMGHWMNEQAMEQFPVRVTIIYKGKAVLYEPVAIHQKLPSSYDTIRKLSPNFKLVPVVKPKTEMEFEINSEWMEKYGKK